MNTEKSNARVFAPLAFNEGQQFIGVARGVITYHVGDVGVVGFATFGPHLFLQTFISGVVSEESGPLGFPEGSLFPSSKTFQVTVDPWLVEACCCQF